MGAVWGDLGLYFHSLVGKGLMQARVLLGCGMRRMKPWVGSEVTGSQNVRAGRAPGCWWCPLRGRGSLWGSRLRPLGLAPSRAWLWPFHSLFSCIYTPR